MNVIQLPGRGSSPKLLAVLTCSINNVEKVPCSSKTIMMAKKSSHKSHLPQVTLRRVKS